MALDTAQPFVWGAGGSRLTPEEIASQRKVADALLANGMDYSPIASPWQGASRIAQALLGGLESGEASVAANRNAADSSSVLQALLAGNSGAATPAAFPASAPMATPPMGTNPIPAGQPDASLPGAITNVASQYGVDPAYMTRLAMVESGGRLDAANPGSSARGPFQFINSTAKQYGLTNPSDPAASADAAARLTLDNKVALTQALGREPTPGELYLAHQQGAGGAAKLLSNPNAPVEGVIGADAARLNGAVPGMTAGQFANKWTGKFADVGSAAAPAQVAARPAINPAILQAVSSPYVSDQTRKIGTMLFQNQMDQQQKANDPKRQLDMQGQRLTNQKMERELQGEGAMPLTAEERASYGIPSTQPAYKTRSGEIKFGPAGSNVNVSTGTIPQGYEQYTDPETKAIRMRPIPGGPKDSSEKDQAKADARATSTDIVTNAANLARNAIASSTLPATGTAGNLLSNIGETGAAELNRQIGVLKSTATIENLNAMRAQSPTGGALGNVTEGEGAMLAAKLGALDPRAPKAQVQRSIDDYERSLLRVVHGKEQGDAIYDKTRPAGDGWQDVGGIKIRRKQ